VGAFALGVTPTDESLKIKTKAEYYMEVRMRCTKSQKVLPEMV